jgi:hypothetical protein
MPLDYFVWAIKGTPEGKERSFIPEAGFDAPTGAKRGRQISCAHPPSG